MYVVRVIKISNILCSLDTCCVLRFLRFFSVCLKRSCNDGVCSMFNPDCCHRAMSSWRLIKKSFFGGHSRFVEPLIPMFWTFGDVCPVFQSQGESLAWIPQIHLWCHTWWPLTVFLSFNPCTYRSCVHKHWCWFEPTTKFEPTANPQPCLKSIKMQRRRFILVSNDISFLLHGY